MYNLTNVNCENERINDQMLSAQYRILRGALFMCKDLVKSYRHRSPFRYTSQSIILLCIIVVMSSVVMFLERNLRMAEKAIFRPAHSTHVKQIMSRPNEKFVEKDTRILAPNVWSTECRPNICDSYVINCVL